MDTELARITPTRKSGAEPFCLGDRKLDCSLQEFWQWSLSDLASNASRGMLAEFIVAKALGISTEGVRDEWQAFDLQTEAGHRLEVKSAAFLQTWAQKRLSKVCFSIRPSRRWDPNVNELVGESIRQSDAYIFALLAHTEKASLDPMNLDQWRFYVVPTTVINERFGKQSTITLEGLERVAGEGLLYDELAQHLEAVLAGA